MEIEKAAMLIRKGELVAFPTETVYGLGANALDAKASRKIFKAKGRPADNPLIVHVADKKMLEKIAHISPAAKKLIDAFWPGPLTILFRKKSIIPSVVTAGLPNVAVRMPENRIALALIKKSGVPIAAPSANRSGRPSPTTAEHVKEDFPDIFVIDGGRTKHGLESTVVAVDGTPRVLRLGAITLERLKRVVPEISIVKSKKIESPGQKYKHYAPKVPLILFNSAEKLKRYAKKNSGMILCKEKEVKKFKNLGNRVIGLGKTDKDVARNIFNELRKHDKGTLLVLGLEKKGIGRAVMDRLERAATRII